MVKKSKKIIDDPKLILEGLPDEALRTLLYIVYDELASRNKLYDVVPPIDRNIYPTIKSILRSIDQKSIDYVHNEMVRGIMGQDAKVIMAAAMYLSADAALKILIKKEEWKEFALKLSELAWKDPENDS